MAKNTYPCPCFSGKIYPDCCKPYHDGKVKPDTAEQLMRARYTAYCYGNIAYLVDTIHPKKRRFGDAMSISKLIKKTRWLGLKILDHKTDGDTAFVDFIAYFLGIDIEQQHELSEFRKYRGQWYYYDGKQLPAIKLSRNDPCFCNSGKKYKKCHATLVDKLG